MESYLVTLRVRVWIETIPLYSYDDEGKSHPPREGVD